MRVGLIDVDSHNFPNLALMKISAYHKAKGDEVEWWWGLGQYDRVYKSKVFDDTYSPDLPDPVNTAEIIKGGTGYGLDNKLPDEIEHMYPDYSLYPELTKDTAFGHLSRGCPRGCPFCLVEAKEGRKSYKVADLSEWWNGQKNIVLCDPNLLACREHIDLLGQLADSKAWVDMNQGVDARMLTEANIEALNKVKIKTIHFAWDLMDQSEAVIKGLRLYSEHGAIQNVARRMVYVLVNFNSTMEENLFRIYTLRDLGYEPFVMVFDKPNAPKEIKRLQRWCNNKYVYKKVLNFEDYE
jgi:hypothetical protein